MNNSEHIQTQYDSLRIRDVASSLDAYYRTGQRRQLTYAVREAGLLYRTAVRERARALCHYAMVGAR